MKSISKVWLYLRRSARCLREDRRGVAAIEFAIFAPIMLLAFFGTVEFCSAVAVDRKVTLIARTLVDLTSQAAVAVDDNYMQNIFTASIAIVAPYDASQTKATISEVYVDKNKVATIQWSKAATITSGAIQATLATSVRNAGDVVTSVIPTQLLAAQTYLIFSEVTYNFAPTIDYAMAKNTVLLLSDVSYTRPRQVTCVIYNGVPASTCPLP